MQSIDCLSLYSLHRMQDSDVWKQAYDAALNSSGIARARLDFVRRIWDTTSSALKWNQAQLCAFPALHYAER